MAICGVCTGGYRMRFFYGLSIVMFLLFINNFFLLLYVKSLGCNRCVTSLAFNKIEFMYSRMFFAVCSLSLSFSPRNWISMHHFVPFDNGFLVNRPFSGKNISHLRHSSRHRVGCVGSCSAYRLSVKLK